MLAGYVDLWNPTYMSQDYIHEQHTVHHILYHIIFCPKRRRKILVGPVRDRFEQITREVADENGWGLSNWQFNQITCISSSRPIPTRCLLTFLA